jgi:uncharacterized membrane protein
MLEQTPLAKKIVWGALIILIAGLIALLTETMAYGHAPVPVGQSIQHAFSTSELLAAASGFEPTQSGIQPTQSPAKLHLDLPSIGHQTLRMTYDAPTGGQIEIEQETAARAVTSTTENLFLRLAPGGDNTAVIRIEPKAVRLVLRLEQTDLEIRTVTLDRKLQLNPARVAFVFFLLSTLALTMLLHLNKARTEALFLVAAVGLGLMMIVLQPVKPIGWDEQIHFKTIHKLSFFGEADIYSGVQIYEDLAIPAADTHEEQATLKAWLDQRYTPAQQIKTESALRFNLNLLPYLPQAITLRLGRILGLSLSTLLFAMKTVQLLIYAGVTALAIRIIPSGKLLLLFYALLPTVLFQSVTLTYDTLTIAAAFLLTAVLMREWSRPSELLTRQSLVLMTVASVFLSLVKPVYLPLVLLCLFLPRSKFKRQKNAWAYRAYILLLVLLLALNFLYPFFIKPVVIENTSWGKGDVRVSDTSVSGQLSYILQQPARYLALLAYHIQKTFGNYIFNKFSYLSYAYAGTLERDNLQFLIILVLFFLSFTAYSMDQDQKEKDTSLPGVSLNGRQKVLILSAIALTIGLIWTALYLSFNPVGSASINGVQPRYYFPFVIPLLLLLSTDRISIRFNRRNVNLAVTTLAILVNAYGLYSHFLVPFHA